MLIIEYTRKRIVNIRKGKITNFKIRNIEKKPTRNRWSQKLNHRRGGG